MYPIQNENHFGAIFSAMATTLTVFISPIQTDLNRATPTNTLKGIGTSHIQPIYPLLLASGDRAPGKLHPHTISARLMVWMRRAE
jgi:hypothetical protein